MQLGKQGVKNIYLITCLKALYPLLLYGIATQFYNIIAHYFLHS